MVTTADKSDFSCSISLMLPLLQLFSCSGDAAPGDGDGAGALVPEEKRLTLARCDEAEVVVEDVTAVSEDFSSDFLEDFPGDFIEFAGDFDAFAGDFNEEFPGDFAGDFLGFLFGDFMVNVPPSASSA